MRATPVAATFRYDIAPLAVGAIYLLAGLAIAVMIYRWMLDALGDPMPAAIVTLILTMMVVVTTGKGSRRS